MQTPYYKKNIVNKSLQVFVKKLNGSAVFSEPKVKLTDKKIDKICRCVKLDSKQDIKKLLQ